MSLHRLPYCRDCLRKQQEIDRLKEENARLKGRLRYQERNAKEAPFGSATPSAKRVNEPDAAGHGSGWGSATWNSQVVIVDTMLGKIFKLIEQDVPAMKSNTVIILTADHGNQDNPVTGADRYSVPFYVWGCAGTRSDWIVVAPLVPFAIYVPPAKDIREFVGLGGTRAMIENTLKSTLWQNG